MADRFWHPPRSDSLVWSRSIAWMISLLSVVPFPFVYANELTGVKLIFKLSIAYGGGGGSPGTRVDGGGSDSDGKWAEWPPGIGDARQQRRQTG